ncbi:hypothetical protein, partial [Klebsiella aerogenes]|uniref:hypothetical protein n=1 Tax=Klebsiella aerogenes TaxID=548 RepID=UPI001CC7CDFE
SCVIPFSHIFRNVIKVISGAKQIIVLVRKGDESDVIWREGGAGKFACLSLWFNAIFQHNIDYTWRPVLMVEEELGKPRKESPTN